MNFKQISRTLALAVATLPFALSAFAQWQWMDKDGRKVFSDRSPPADIQEQNILKRPAGSARPAAQPVPEAVAGGTPTGAASAPSVKVRVPKLSGKDAELEAKKKKAEDEESAMKKVDEEKAAKARGENCDRAKSGLATLQSGVRMASVNAKGEREVFDDAKRTAETRRTQDVIDSDCK